MPITEFPIATTLVEDLIPTKLPNPGLVSHNVAQMATAGSGTYADPWTGWDTVLEATLVASKLAQTFRFPSGVYGYSVSPNFGRRSHCQFIGEKGTILKYSGTGVAMNFLAEESDVGSAVTNFGIVCKNFLIDGTASGTYGVYLGSIHHSLFEHIGVRGDFDVGFKLEFTICNTYNMLRVTPRVGDSGNDDDAATMPAIGIYADTGSIVGAGPFQTVQACTFIDPVIELLAGGSIPIGGTAAAYFGTGCHQNVIIGGTFEQNNTRNFVLGGNGNVIIGTDNEYPADADETDFLCFGDDNQFINCLATDSIIIGESVSGNIPKGNKIIGGTFNWIKIHPIAQHTVIDGPAYNFSITGGFYDGSYTTIYKEAPRDFTSATVTKGFGFKAEHGAVFKQGAVFPTSTLGPTLTAPDGGRWRLTVDNAGALTTTAGSFFGMEPQSDAFTDNSIGDQWIKGTLSATAPSSLVTVAESSAQINITLPNSTAGSNFAGLISCGRALADTGYERIKLISKPTTGLASYQVRFGIGTSLSSSALFMLENTTLYAVNNGSVVNSVAFVLANMEYWRFLRAGADIKLQYSTDGSSWTDFHTVAGSTWATNPYVVCFEAGSTASATFDAPVVFDDYVYFKG